MEQLFNLAKRALGKQEADNSTYYVLFDEIQYQKDWEVNLKSLVDTYRNVKFVASGSAAAVLKKKSNESGAGRFTDFSLPPLTFYEYIHIRQFQNIVKDTTISWHDHDIPFKGAVDIERFNEYFIDYINYGGYPEVQTPGTVLFCLTVGHQTKKNRPRCLRCLIVIVCEKVTLSFGSLACISYL